MMKLPSTLLTIALAGILIAPAALTAEASRVLEPEQFQMRADQGTVTLIDVRTPAEYTAGHIVGALLLNYLDASDFAKGLQRLPKNATYFVYCLTGHRSRMAVDQMKKAGFTDVHEMKGGVNAWRLEHLPLHESTPAAKPHSKMAAKTVQ